MEITTMSNDHTNIGTKERDRAIRRIAILHLDIKSLETRKRDALDFYDLAVWSIRSALNAAYAAGYEQAVTDRERPAEPEEVAEPDGCPNCGERHPDRLIWSEEGDSIACHSCGTTYSIQPDS